MHKMTKLALFASALLLLLSCEEDTTLRYNNVTMADIIEGVIVSDQGNTFNIVEQTCPGNHNEMDRVMIICDVLAKTGDNEYDIRLTRMADVLRKETKLLSGASEDEETVTRDPVTITDLWISGGYINMYVMFEIVPGSGKSHYMNLLWDQENSKDGKYRFELWHNANGEVFPTEEGADNSDFKFGGSYVSFPISQIIEEQEAEITINCLSHKITDGYIWHSETVEHNITRRYSKNTFEHTPASAGESRLIFAFSR